jgi:hypothetical protein
VGCGEGITSYFFKKVTPFLRQGVNVAQDFRHGIRIMDVKIKVVCMIRFFDNAFFLMHFQTSFGGTHFLAGALVPVS